MKIITFLIALGMPSILLAEGTGWYPLQQDTFHFQQSKSWKLFSTDVFVISDSKGVAITMTTVTFWKSKKALVRCFETQNGDETKSLCAQLDDDGEF